MKEFSMPMAIAVLEEIFGRGLFWLMIAVAAIVAIIYFYILIRDRSVGWKKFLLAQLSMPVGAIGSVMFIQHVTHSGFADLGGPVDLMLLLGVAFFGAIGVSIAVYTAETLIGTERTARAVADASA